MNFQPTKPKCMFVNLRLTNQPLFFHECIGGTAPIISGPEPKVVGFSSVCLWKLFGFALRYMTHSESNSVTSLGPCNLSMCMWIPLF